MKKIIFLVIFLIMFSVSASALTIEGVSCNDQGGVHFDLFFGVAEEGKLYSENVVARMIDENGKETILTGDWTREMINKNTRGGTHFESDDNLMNMPGAYTFKIDYSIEMSDGSYKYFSNNVDVKYCKAMKFSCNELYIDINNCVVENGILDAEVKITGLYQFYKLGIESVEYEIQTSKKFKDVDFKGQEGNYITTGKLIEDFDVKLIGEDLYKITKDFGDNKIGYFKIQYPKEYSDSPYYVDVKYCWSKQNDNDYSEMKIYSYRGCLTANKVEEPIETAKQPEEEVTSTSSVTGETVITEKEKVVEKNNYIGVAVIIGLAIIVSSLILRRIRK